MLTIRLSRIGKNKKPTYRLIISEKTKDTFGDSLEILGYYNPRANPKIVSVKNERVKYWLSVGAKTSPTVHNLLVDQKIIEGPKVKVSKLKKKKGEAPKEGAKEAAAPAETKEIPAPASPAEEKK